MPRKQHKYHFLYKTTNIINEKFYVGMHSTSDINDGYLGSGKRLRYAINKYGKENFKREILQFFKNKENLAKAETDIVNEDLLKDPLCMNLMIGGNGGTTYGFKGKKRSKQHKDKMFNAFKKKLDDPIFRKEFGNTMSKVNKEYFENGGINAFKNKKHTKESKDKIGKNSSIRQKGKLNSCYGTCWIYNLELKIIKRIKKEELNNWLNLGWIKGAKHKWN